MAIIFDMQDTKFMLQNRRKVSAWIKECARGYDKKVGNISIVFCSDSYILDVNKRYLQHDYYTDIITFDYGQGDLLEGDLIISIDTIRSNSKRFEVLFHVELLRVIAHGVLHLVGFDDRSEEDVPKMRAAEDDCLKLWEFKYGTKD